MDRDFRTYKIDRASQVDAKQVESLLCPLLKADDRPTAAEMLAATRPLIEAVLDHDREASYLAAIADGKYRPELLFPEQPKSWREFASIRRYLESGQRRSPPDQTQKVLITKDRNASVGQ